MRDMSDRIRAVARDVGMPQEIERLLGVRRTPARGRFWISYLIRLLTLRLYRRIVRAER